MSTQDKKDQMILVKHSDYVRLKKVAEKEDRTMKAMLTQLINAWEKKHG